MAALVPSANAIHSGIAVSASEKLWMVSASSATDPEISTITSCATDGGAQGEQADLHRPDTGGAGFQRPVDAVGGVVAVRSEHLPQRRTDLAATPSWLCP